MAVLRPVAHEDRLTLVEHLGELRARIFVSLAILVVAFSVTYWQNERVLDIVNRPLQQAQDLPGDCREAGDSLEKSGCFDRAVAQALDRLTPALDDLSRTTSGLAAAGSVASRQAAADQVARVRRATAALKEAVALAPRSNERRPVTLGVAEPFFQTVNVSLYAALVLALPLLLYQLYAFLIPAFTRRERRVIVPMMVGIPLLFYAGVAFGYFLALPRAVDFLQNFNDQAFDILVQARDYYKFVTLFLAGTGVVFQIPVLVIGISRLGVISVRQLRKQRGIVILIAAVVSAVITPTPDPVTMLLVMAPLVVLFEISLVIAAVLERRSPPGSRWSQLWDDDDDDDGDPWEPDPGGPSSPPAGGDPEPPDWGPARPARPADPVVGEEDDPGPGTASKLDWLEEDADAPVGEQPDPALLGDPRGPRVAGDDDPPWWEAADELDAEDPYADGDRRG